MIATLKGGATASHHGWHRHQLIMNEADALDIINQAIWTVIVASGPAVGAAMLAGVCIALFQALTQIQEITLTFVPKILVILAVLASDCPVRRLADQYADPARLFTHREWI